MYTFAALCFKPYMHNTLKMQLHSYDSDGSSVSICHQDTVSPVETPASTKRCQTAELAAEQEVTLN